jgi:Zn-dependent peptidase ImmA (M78 family)/transcriptional regulator with XRE-family HTH domain
MLRLARQRLGLTQKNAAEQLGIIQPLLSRFENGVSEPDSAFVIKASLVYKVPTEFFSVLDPVYGPPVSVHPMTRAKADVTARELEMITAELNVRLMHLRRFLESVEFSPKTTIPSLDVEQYGTPEKIASTLRSHWGMPAGPVKNLMQWVERAGVVVGLSKFGGASVSGVTFRVSGLPPLILLNAFHPADRMRFTLAHELGHLVMHRFPTAEMEDEANSFASCFLMPTADIRPSLSNRKITLELLAGLKIEWKVAIQAILMRAASLNLLSPNQNRYLWQQISMRGWRLKEPAELDFPHEIPKIMTSVIKSHLTDFGYSVGQLTTLVKTQEWEFSEFYGSLGDATHDRPRLRLVT